MFTTSYQTQVYCILTNWCIFITISCECGVNCGGGHVEHAARDQARHHLGEGANVYVCLPGECSFMNSLIFGINFFSCLQPEQFLQRHLFVFINKTIFCFNLINKCKHMILVWREMNMFLPNKLYVYWGDFPQFQPVIMIAI